MRLYDYLPQEIITRNTTFVRFYVVVPESLNFAKANRDAVTQIKLEGKKYRIIYVLSKNLRGRTDLYGKLYEPLEYIYVEKSPEV